MTHKTQGDDQHDLDLLRMPAGGVPGHGPPSPARFAHAGDGGDCVFFPAVVTG